MFANVFTFNLRAIRLKMNLIIVLIFVLANFLSGTVNAASLHLEKDQNNPFNTNFYILQSTVTKENGEYKMWFTGSNGTNLKIRYASSIDGLNWPTSELVTVNDTGDNHDPSLFKHEGNNYIYYISEPSEGSGTDIKVKKATATGAQFDTPVLINLNRQQWNSQKLSCPFGYFENGTYFLFYCGTAGSGWNLGLASSIDGINFTPCSNNPIISGGDVGNTQLYTDEHNVKHLLYHSTSGITEVTSVGPLSCNSVWTNYHTFISRDKPYDQTYIIAPSLLYDSSPKELFYTAKGPATSGEWKLNRVVENTSKSKIIIIPGFFASWNQEAILHNSETNDWIIPTYVHEYDGLMQSLENVGYKKNIDYFVYPYDWRKSLSESADNLHNFLQTNIWSLDDSNTVSLVGHSMGGLLSRIYAQKYSSDKISQVVTVGSPHKGVVQVYQPLEAGETKKDDSFLWLGTKLLINLNRYNFRTDREIVRNLIPSLYDLFPTYDFLKNKKGNRISVNSLSIQNNALNEYSDTTSIDNKMTVIYGNKTINKTPKEIVVGNRALFDLLTRDYLDGRPLSYIYGAGDYLVPLISSQFGSAQVQLPLDHGELIYKSEGIKQIFSNLNVPFSDDQIEEGEETKISPSILITAQSPIAIELELGDNTYSSEGGMIFLPNAESGTYKLHVKKLSAGDYTITLAQIAEKNDVWEQFTGQITEKYVDEEDIYTIRFDRSSAQSQISHKNCSKFIKHRMKRLFRYDCKIKKRS